ncbi:hypothetical protein S83_047613, partial [Arachis hypogaea]
LYRFLVRRTGSNFNAVTLNRLFMNKVNWPPLSLSSRKRFVFPSLIFLSGKAVVMGIVTDDSRMYEVPALKVIAPRFIETAHARIEMAG